MRLFEKHKNGSIIDIDGESAIVADHLVQWRAYQDRLESKPRTVGFIPEEVKKSGDD